MLIPNFKRTCDSLINIPGSVLPRKRRTGPVGVTGGGTASGLFIGVNKGTSGGGPGGAVGVTGRVTGGRGGDSDISVRGLEGGGET